MIARLRLTSLYWPTTAQSRGVPLGRRGSVHARRPVRCTSTVTDPAGRRGSGRNGRRDLPRRVSSAVLTSGITALAGTTPTCRTEEPGAQPGHTESDRDHPDGPKQAERDTRLCCLRHNYPSLRRGNSGNTREPCHGTPSNTFRLAGGDPSGSEEPAEHERTACSDVPNAPRQRRNSTTHRSTSSDTRPSFERGTSNSDGQKLPEVSNRRDATPLKHARPGLAVAVRRVSDRVSPSCTCPLAKHAAPHACRLSPAPNHSDERRRTPHCAARPRHGGVGATPSRTRSSRARDRTTAGRAGAVRRARPRQLQRARLFDDRISVVNV
ncbi:hypothetical protein SAMN06265360_10473 [Haloechinothrix alba]|uniref:Uncharacterized protein n=1 Tax=Haloechinothrix alba TaxID=664784 RepID=A0A238VUB1_9PSEU|nr:hypothetical protein SAMN06265360_10473 [Haloechinothrix alba]